MSTPSIEVHWLPRLRWAAVAALTVSIAGTKWLLHAPFPIEPLMGVVLLLALVNVVLLVHLKKTGGLSERAVTANLLIDTAALTAMLVWAGGAMNPFTTLYLLHVALAGILVGRIASLIVAVCAVLCFGALLMARPEAIHIWHSASMFDLHVRGMWVAFAMTALCLWFFVGRVAVALRERERELAQVQLNAARAQRLAAVGTLAAGAAHELNTPLGTVAIQSAELSSMLSAHPEAKELVDSIRAEIKRCKQILTRMRPADVTELQAEPLLLGTWIDEVTTRWRESRSEAVLSIVNTANGGVSLASPASLEIALIGLLDNARRAHIDAAVTAAIVLKVERRENEHWLTVIDQGAGMSSAIVARASEPFFTTREPGDGMGLGLYLSRATVERFGGRLVIESAPQNTAVSLVLPAQ